MMKLLLTAVAIFISGQTIIAQSSSADEQAIRKVLDAQIVSWNNGDLEKFMETYWNDDSLMFIGKNGITYGYNNTLANYKKKYPGKEAMGKLIFHILKVDKLSDEYYFVVGQWTLKRKSDEPGGHYTLLFRKINNKWLIVADHSS